MKAIRILNRNRILTTLVFLVFVVSLAYSQGFLADNSMKIFNSSELLSEQLDFDRSNSNDVTGTFHLPSAEASYEAELETEKWMTKSFENRLEANAVESWMTQSFSESLESIVKVEAWMSISFTESVEKELTVEDWMTQILPAV